MDERLHKIIARAGVASRREAEELILAGRVTVGGRQVATLGTRADADRDDIRVDGRPVNASLPRAYWMLHKPPGYTSTAADPYAERTVLDLLPASAGRLYPAGRLDRESEGLVLLTDDGEMTERLLHPRYHLPREYAVLVHGRITDEVLEQLRRGVEVEGVRTQPAEVEPRDPPRNIARVRGDDPYDGDDDAYSVWLTFILHEGRKRQIREMCRRVGLTVERLIRMSLGPLTLGRLRVGEARPLAEREVTALRRAAGLEQGGGRAAAREERTTMTEHDSPTGTTTGPTHTPATPAPPLDQPGDEDPALAAPEPAVTSDPFAPGDEAPAGQSDAGAGEDAATGDADPPEASDERVAIAYTDAPLSLNDDEGTLDEDAVDAADLIDEEDDLDDDEDDLDDIEDDDLDDELVDEEDDLDDELVDEDDDEDDEDDEDDDLDDDELDDDLDDEEADLDLLLADETGGDARPRRPDGGGPTLYPGGRRPTTPPAGQDRPAARGGSPVRGGGRDQRGPGARPGGQGRPGYAARGDAGRGPGAQFGRPGGGPGPQRGPERGYRQDRPGPGDRRGGPPRDQQYGRPERPFRERGGDDYGTFADRPRGRYDDRDDRRPPYRDDGGRGPGGRGAPRPNPDSGRYEGAPRGPRRPEDRGGFARGDDRYARRPDDRGGFGRGDDRYARRPDDRDRDQGERGAPRYDDRDRRGDFDRPRRGYDRDDRGGGRPFNRPDRPAGEGDRRGGRPWERERERPAPYGDRPEPRRRDDGPDWPPPPRGQYRGQDERPRRGGPPRPGNGSPFRRPAGPYDRAARDDRGGAGRPPSGRGGSGGPPRSGPDRNGGPPRARDQRPPRRDDRGRDPRDSGR